MTDDKRQRQNIDVDPVIQARIKQLAKELKVTESALWNFFAAEGLLEVDNEDSSVWRRLRKGRGIRYKNIDIDDLIDLLKDRLRDDD